VTGPADRLGVRRVRVLVAHAGRMGGTAEIAERVGRRLEAAGCKVDVRPCVDVADVVAYDAVVVGSALYARRWESTALELLQAQLADLGRRPVWLFQSGPSGLGAEDQVVRAPRVVRRLAARGHLQGPVTFGGRLDPTRATDWLQRFMTAPPHAGDWRDWSRIDAWADEIARELAAARATAGVQPEDQQLR